MNSQKLRPSLNPEYTNGYKTLVVISWWKFEPRYFSRLVGNKDNKTAELVTNYHLETDVAELKTLVKDMDKKLYAHFSVIMAFTAVNHPPREVLKVYEKKDEKEKQKDEKAKDTTNKT